MNTSRLRRVPAPLLGDRRGVSSAEYAVLLIAVLLGSIAAWRGFGQTIICTLGSAQSQYVLALGGETVREMAGRCVPAATQGSALVRGPGPSLSAAANPPGGGGAMNAFGSPPPVGGPVPPAMTTLANDTTGLGFEIDALAAQSPHLADDLHAARAAGYEIYWGTGTGTYTSHDSNNNPVLVVDDSNRGNPNAVVQVLAHELGHATYAQPTTVFDPTYVGKAAWVAQRTKEMLKDEAEATFANIEARDDIWMASIAKGGPGVDIGINGETAGDFTAIYRSVGQPDIDAAGNPVLNPDGTPVIVTREMAIDRIAELWRPLTQSGPAGQTYNAAYTAVATAEWDANMAAWQAEQLRAAQEEWQLKQSLGVDPGPYPNW